MADALNFDFDAVTPRMLVDFKEKTGADLLTVFDGAAEGQMDLSKLDSLVLAGIIWVAMRMSGYPEATWDEALDTPLSRLDLSGGEAEDPTSASSAAS